MRTALTRLPTCWCCWRCCIGQHQLLLLLLAAGAAQQQLLQLRDRLRGYQTVLQRELPWPLLLYLSLWPAVHYTEAAAGWPWLGHTWAFWLLLLLRVLRLLLLLYMVHLEPAWCCWAGWMVQVFLQQQAIPAGRVLLPQLRLPAGFLHGQQHCCWQQQQQGCVVR